MCEVTCASRQESRRDRKKEEIATATVKIAVYMTKAKILIVPAMPSTNQMCPRAATDVDVGTSVVQGVPKKPQKPGSILGLNRDNGKEKGNSYIYIYNTHI